MASSVTVNINARDNTRAGVRNLRRDIDNLRRQLPPDHTINVNLNDDQAFNRAGRLRRNLRNLPDDVTIRVNTTGPDRRDRHRLVTTLQRSLTSPFRVMGRTLGGIMSDGLGQGIIGAFQAAGPVGMAVLAAIIFASLSVIGAALSGLLVAAFGLAFVGIAGWSAATSKEVREQWGKTLKSLTQNFREVGEPMIPVLNRALEKLEEMGDKVAPIFQKAIDSATPATNQFIDKIFEGITRMGKEMFQPIMDAWEVFAPVFGDVLADSMARWGESFAEMARLVREHSVEIEIALRIVMGIIDFLIDTVTFFGQAWVWSLNTVGDAISAVIDNGLYPLLNTVLTVFETILGAAESSFSWVPGLGPKLTKAKGDFTAFKETALAALQNMSDKAGGFDDTLTKMNRTRVLKADIRSWQHDLETAKAKLKSVPKSKQSKVKAEISDLTHKINRAKSELASLKDKTVNVYVNAQSNIAGGAAAFFRASGGNVGSSPRIPAAATGGNRGNKVMVGEHGPEIVDLPGGSHVRSNSDTRRYLSQQVNQGPVPTMRIEAAHDDVSQFLLRLLRRSIRSEGGDVQFVLGQN